MFVFLNYDFYFMKCVGYVCFSFWGYSFYFMKCVWEMYVFLFWDYNFHFTKVGNLREGGARGGKAGFATLSAFPLVNCPMPKWSP